MGSAGVIFLIHWSAMSLWRAGGRSTIILFFTILLPFVYPFIMWPGSVRVCDLIVVYYVLYLLLRQVKYTILPLYWICRRRSINLDWTDMKETSDDLIKAKRAAADQSIR